MMKRLFTILACSLLLNTAATRTSAQTPPIDDCPAGFTLHHSLTALDHDSMLAAYTASFVGLFHRQPSMAAGSGVDDGNYWINISNHYGLYGDNICRAGWNLYRERQVGGIPTGPTDGDLPAQFLPSTVVVTPPVTPPPTPPPPIISTDLTSILNAINALASQIATDDSAIEARIDTDTAAIAAAVNKPAWYTRLVSNKYVQIVGAAVVAWAATKKAGG